MCYLLFQSLILIVSCLLIVSQECSKNEVYKESEKPGSCKEILANYPATPSGYYWLQSSDHFTSHKVYCDMENERCGSKGWTRVALIDMSKGARSCPGNLTLITGPRHTCGGPTGDIGCASVIFHTHGISYSQVCGRLRGYQVGPTDAFGPHVNDHSNADLVMDGVLISHGETQKHIWAYATGQERVVSSSTIDTASYNTLCPCADPRYDGAVPPFIGNDYYCDSGVESAPVAGQFYTTPLWTGEGCAPPNFCCSHSGMPWFCKTLPVPTTDYIEIRNCRNELHENTALEQMELFIY